MKHELDTWKLNLTGGVERVTHLQPNLLEVEVHGSGYGVVAQQKVEQVLNIGQKVACYIGPCVPEIVFSHNTICRILLSLILLKHCFLALVGQV